MKRPCNACMLSNVWSWEGGRVVILLKHRCRRRRCVVLESGASPMQKGNKTRQLRRRRRARTTTQQSRQPHTHTHFIPRPQCSREPHQTHHRHTTHFENTPIPHSDVGRRSAVRSCSRPFCTVAGATMARQQALAERTLIDTAVVRLIT